MSFGFFRFKKELTDQEIERIVDSILARSEWPEPYPPDIGGRLDALSGRLDTLIRDVEGIRQGQAGAQPGWQDRLSALDGTAQRLAGCAEASRGGLDVLHQALKRQEDIQKALEQDQARSLQVLEQLQSCTAPQSGEQIEKLQSELKRYQGLYQQAADQLEQYKAQIQSIAAEAKHASEELKRWQGGYQALSQTLAARDEEIRQLQARLDRLEQKRPQDGPPASVPAPLAPISPKTLNVFLERVLDTDELDRFLAENNDGNGEKYQKMFERYKKDLRKRVEGLDADDDLESTLQSILAVIQDRLLKKVVAAASKGAQGGDPLETGLMERLHEYLKCMGLYPRDTIFVGKIADDGDFNDMEPIPARQAGGHRQREIVSIELYPYYLDFIDEDGEQNRVNTQGLMVVIA